MGSQQGVKYAKTFAIGLINAQKKIKTKYCTQGFPNSIKGRGMRHFTSRIFSSGGRNLMRRDNDHSNLFQS